jgi:hypothetical protein
MELALAAVAIALSVFAVAFELLFYNWQTGQGARITETVNNFAKEMHGVLGEIKGLTTGTWQELREQFKFVLDKALNQERASIGEEVAPRVEALEGQIDALEAKLSTTGHDELSTMVGELKRDVGALQRDLAALRQSAPSVGRGEPTDSEALRIARGFLGSKVSFPTVADLWRQALTDTEMTRLLKDLATGPGDAPWMMFKYGEAFKAAERAGLIETYHDAGQTGFGVRLTDAGRAFLAGGPPMKNGAAE